jgi:hypothetical protein
MTIYNGYRTKAAALRALHDAGYKFVSLLSRADSNPKLAKNGKLGVVSAPLHLAPFNLSGFQVCAKASAGCAAACIHFAGNPAHMAGKDASRKDKTRAYFLHRKAFMALLAFEIAALRRKAERNGIKISNMFRERRCAVRLNATSDLPFERRTIDVDGETVSLMDHFADVQFYDYTAIPKRAISWAKRANNWPPNYHITFSRKEDNDDDVRDVLAAGGNVAAVFRGNPFKNGFTSRQLDAVEALGGQTLFDGDVSDYRPDDPRGVIVALKAKGDARKDESGFVI